MEKSNNNKAQDYLPRIRVDISRRFPMIGSFLLLSFVLLIVLRGNFPILVSLIVLSILFCTFLALFVFSQFKNRAPELVVDFYFLIICIDTALLTIIIYLLGGITWIAPFFYSFIIINVFWLFPKNKAIFLIGLSFFFFLSLVSLQYFEILPNSYLFPPGESNIQNFYYTIATAVGSLSVLFFLGYSSDIYRRILDRQIMGLKKAERQLQITKDNLEQEIQERTEDLEKEKKNLEREVTKRTRELEGKRKIVRARVKELEKFHNIAVERELEMAQLKEKITNLKNKAKNE